MISNPELLTHYRDLILKDENSHHEKEGAFLGLLRKNTVSNKNEVSALEFEEVYFSYPGQPVINNLSFQVPKGNDITALLGPSGSGKTTILRLIAGFESQTSGIIHIDGRVVASNSISIPPEQRRVGLVFQDYALFPHLTVEKNIQFGLNKLEKKAKLSRCEEMLELVGMLRYKDRYPHELSGGQQQRVALARSLAPHPPLLLLDEPFSNLDASVKGEVMEEVLKIVKSHYVPTILVTHDLHDVIRIADRVIQLGEVKE